MMGPTPLEKLAALRRPYACLKVRVRARRGRALKERLGERRRNRGE